MKNALYIFDSDLYLEIKARCRGNKVVKSGGAFLKNSRIMLGKHAIPAKCNMYLDVFFL